MNRYNIRKILVWPAFKFGAIIGAVLLIVPALVGALALRSLIATLNAIFAGLGALLAFTDIGFIDTLQTWNDQGFFLVLALTLGVIIVGGLWCGIAAAVAAAIYNLVAKMGGGLVVGADLLAATLPAAASPAPALPVAPPIAPPAAAIAPTAPAALPMPSAAAATVASSPAAPLPAVQPQPAAPMPPAPAGPWLGLSRDPNVRWPVRPDRTRLGAAADNEVALQGLNAYHAEIRMEGNYFVLYDLSNGQVWVNDRPVAGRNMLKEGFRIRLGGIELIFHTA